MWKGHDTAVPKMNALMGSRTRLSYQSLQLTRGWYDENSERES